MAGRAGRSGRDEVAVGQTDGAVGDRSGPLLVVRGNDDRGAAGPCAQRVGEALALLVIEMGIGLVEHQQFGVADERCRQRNPSSLTTGEAPAPLARQVGELHLA